MFPTPRAIHAILQCGAISVRAATSFTLVTLFAAFASSDDGRVDRWRADLTFLANELPKRHVNLFFKLGEEEWRDGIAKIDGELSELPDYDVVIAMTKLVASVGDGHTSVQIGTMRRPLPIEVAWFADGIHVIAAPKQHEAALGGRVVKVGDVAIDEAYRRLCELVSHENDAWPRVIVPQYFAYGTLLHAQALSDDPEHARFTVQIADGKQLELALAVAPANPAALARLEPDAKPLWLARRSEPYWFTWIEASRTLFFQYNECADDAKHPMKQFAQELFAEFDARKPERLLIDLRHNSGGNSRVLDPVLNEISARGAALAHGHLFAAIGASTFSSGLLNAFQLCSNFGAILLGEPTGGKPNCYGEIKYLELPNSKIQISYSTKHFHIMENDPPSLMPDVEAPLKFADFKIGRDPVIEAMLAWKP